MDTLMLSPSEDDIQVAAELLKKSEVVAIPTETVYGLAANAFDEEAVRKIFKAKGSPLRQSAYSSYLRSGYDKGHSLRGASACNEMRRTLLARSADYDNAQKR